MPGSHASTRLGDLLIKKGKISRQQLLEAIRFQQDRRFFDAQQGIAPSAKNELGHILIELGFISRKQLRNCLSWQRKLRKVSLLLTFFAPLLTVACGGGGGGSADVVKTPSQASSFSVSTYSSKASSSSKLAFSASSVSSSRPASSSSSSSPAVGIDGPVLINWTPPTHRENGEFLDIAAVGGYELRYKLKNSSQYKSVRISSGYTDSYYFDYLKGNYEFEIAAFDTNGDYSDFVPIEQLL